jgi:hypothetical protein
MSISREAKRIFACAAAGALILGGPLANSLAAERTMKGRMQLTSSAFAEGQLMGTYQRQ